MHCKALTQLAVDETISIVIQFYLSIDLSRQEFGDGLRMSFDFLTPPLLAIDIGSSSVKMLELTGRGASKSLRSYAVEVLPPGLVHDGVIQDVGSVQSCINRLGRSVAGKNRRVALSLGGSALVIKKVTMPIGKDIAIEEQIPYYAEQAFQLDPAGLYFDWVMLPRRVDRPESVDALLVGARREIVEQHVSCIRDAGMRVGVIECSAFSMANVFEHSYGKVNGLIAIISVGSSHTQISFILDGVFLFNRDISIGGETYTRRIMETLNQQYDSAESLKLAASMSSTGASPDVLKIISEINDQVVYDLNATLAYFMQSGDVAAGTTLKYAFLTGGASRTIGLDAAIATGLQAAVYQLNPFQRINVNDNKFQIDQLIAMSPVLGVVAGLSLRQMKDKE